MKRNLSLQSILILVTSVIMFTFYSCKKNDNKELDLNSTQKIDLITSENDAVKNFEQYFVLVNNIANYPDTSLLKKFFNNTGSNSELTQFSRNLGFKSINDLYSELFTLSNNIKFTKKHYSELFENEGERVKQIARATFEKNKKFYNISFNVKIGYKMEPAINLAARTQVSDCCPCTRAYNLAMDQAFWLAATQTEVCAGIGLATGGIGGALCMIGVTSQYYINVHYAEAAWDDCVTNGTGFEVF